MERGSDQHGARQDDRLEAELTGVPGSAGGHREERADPEPPPDDAARTAAEKRLARLRHDLEVANDSRYEDRDVPGMPDE